MIKRYISLAAMLAGLALASSRSDASMQEAQTVFIILMENHNWSSIKGSSSAPYINNTLLPMASRAEQYYNPPGLHPSLPNYIWLEAGSNLGITNDGTPTANHQSTTNHLVTALKNAGISWRSYQEDICGCLCPLVVTNKYAPKHNPMVYFDDVTNTNNANSAYCIANVRSYATFVGDLTNNNVGRYNFITPNQCNDMHDTSGCATSDTIKNGDNWLSNNIPAILNSQVYSNNGVIFITWDEGAGTSDGPIGMIVLSRLAKVGGYTNTIHYTHSSTLRTMQEIFNVLPYMRDATNATDLSDLFNPFLFAPATWTNANASGNWSDLSNWNLVEVPDFGSSVIFGTAGLTSVVDSVSRTVSNITFNRSGDFYVTASGGASLTINNGITVTTNFTYTISAPVVLGRANTWSITNNGTLQVNGPTSGTNSITKTGSGTLVLSGTNTYSGATVISNGTLRVIGAGLITNTASIDIASGATLDVSGRTGGSMTLGSGQTLKGNGMIQGNLIFGSASTLSPGGSSIGTLTFLNDLVVSNTAVLQYDLGTNSDLTAVSSNLTLGGTLNINDAGGFTAGVYTLFTYGGALTDSGLTIGTTPNPSYLYLIDTNAAGQVRLNVVFAPIISVTAGDLRDASESLMPTSGVAVLAVDMGTNGFVNLQSAFPLSIDATWGTDDKVVGLWDLRDTVSCSEHDGTLCAQTVVAYMGGIATGQKLQLYWFPSLTLASNTLGVTYYGKYTDTNSPPLDGSDAWTLPASGSGVGLVFITASEGGANPDVAGRATLLTAVSLVASFTGSPTNGPEPLVVTFSDTSTGTITNRFWDFGDSSSTNITTNVVVHTYAAGTYSVTLVVTGPDGASTNAQPNYITALTAFQSWQILHFGSISNPDAAANADPDGDGQSNITEFLTGTDPTNSASFFGITAITPVSTNILITWQTGPGKTNALERTAGAGGSFSNDFAAIFTVTNTVGNTTNYLDIGAATSVPAFYYRIRLVP